MRRTLLGAAIVACVTLPAAAQTPASASPEQRAAGMAYFLCVNDTSAGLAAFSDVPLPQVFTLTAAACFIKRDALDRVWPGHGSAMVDVFTPQWIKTVETERARRINPASHVKR